MQQFELDIQAKFNKCAGFNELWRKLKIELGVFGIQSMFYGLGYSERLVKEKGLFNALWHKHDHPEDAFKRHTLQHFVDNDLSAVHCLYRNTPFLWHDKELWKHATDTQEEAFSDSFKYGLGVGVTIPLRFKDCGIGGMGLSAGRMSQTNFNKTWNENQQIIVIICRQFDQIARSKFKNSFHKLTEKETEVLNRLAIGDTGLEIQEELGIEKTAFDTRCQNFRKKLQAKNTAHAVFIGSLFDLITP